VIKLPENIMKKVLFLSLIMLSPSIFADWVLDNDQSTLNFITTKNASKTEIQSFDVMQGRIDKKQAVLTVDLKSVDTGITIRDERLRKLFFNVADFPKASVRIALDQEKIKSIKKGQSKTFQLDAEINLHGLKRTLLATVKVIALDEHQLMVISENPLVIDLKGFALLDGVNQLRKIAKLKSINSAIPVTFSLVFSKE